MTWETNVVDPDTNDRAQFSAWARSRQAHLLRVALLLSGDHARAEDLVQDALTQVALRWSRLRDGRPDAYARKVIYHSNVDWWRSRRHEVLTSLPADRASVSEPTELRLLMRRALATLTPRQRAVIVLRYYEDLTERDTAEVLGISVGTVKSQTHLALRRLREAQPELSDFLHEEPR